eukprot:CAMPEP_0205824036 /NCGR_PEP_ID=MMETSP0206-20130828/19141_1 /ASSEMBLY_ACC=CAM_ASM_000279 /TAXON_ID=36767 /ORGANISM="Euplotes focardii, Strain TN1" /LENGTH=31 /DNA_ID= /DNA_START= /DNA_END= /DNA_ORIENTATION=
MAAPELVDNMPILDIKPYHYKDAIDLEVKEE